MKIRNANETAHLIHSLNLYNVVFCAACWLFGLTYFNWLSEFPLHLPWIQDVLLAGVGLLMSVVVIAGGSTVIAGKITKCIAGDCKACALVFCWAAVLAPMTTFVLSYEVLQLMT
jgi:hypothetical protein